MGGGTYVNLYVTLRIHIKDLIKQITIENVKQIVNLITYAYLEDYCYENDENNHVYKQLFSEVIWNDIPNLGELEDNIKEKIWNEYDEDIEDKIQNTYYEEVIKFLNNLVSDNFYIHLTNDNEILDNYVYDSGRSASFVTLDKYEEKKKNIEKLQKELNLTDCEITLYMVN